ncbi:uncharacterized protein LOC126964781 [Leptidea sinapis]|uniref:uncharacterized protein LOC126964781 n=1 Tax=Leptidea sinapis TaxID=189913 RepID=UPI0021C2A536|nr:uncharacterized protein LOC126964781 [Leptidea sinapis]
MGEVEPMDVDSLEDYFDNKENTFHLNNNPRALAVEKFDDLDASEFNMKLRYSVTPASSPMSKSYTANSIDNKNNEDQFNDVNISQNLTHSLNSTLTQDITRSHKSLLPLQAISNEEIVDINRSTSVRQILDTTQNKNETIILKTSEDIEENTSLPSTSSSFAHTPEATTPLREAPKQESTSPIMRGLKSVLSMFKTSQNTSTTPTESDNQQTEVEPININTCTHNILASTPISNKINTSKQKSQLKESVCFKDDFERELEWKENSESEIFFKEERIPVHKLFPILTTSPEKVSNICANNNINITVEHMDISLNESVKDCTVTDQVKILINDDNKLVESDSEFVDCETTNNKSDYLDVSTNKSHDSIVKSDCIQNNIKILKEKGSKNTDDTDINKEETAIFAHYSTLDGNKVIKSEDSKKEVIVNNVFCCERPEQSNKIILKDEEDKDTDINKEETEIFAHYSTLDGNKVTKSEDSKKEVIVNNVFCCERSEQSNTMILKDEEAKDKDTDINEEETATAIFAQYSTLEGNKVIKSEDSKKEVIVNNVFCCERSEQSNKIILKDEEAKDKDTDINEEETATAIFAQYSTLEGNKVIKSEDSKKEVIVNNVFCCERSEQSNKIILKDEEAKDKDTDINEEETATAIFAQYSTLEGNKVIKSEDSKKEVIVNNVFCCERSEQSNKIILKDEEAKDKDTDINEEETATAIFAQYSTLDGNKVIEESKKKDIANNAICCDRSEQSNKMILKGEEEKDTAINIEETAAPLKCCKKLSIFNEISLGKEQCSDLLTTMNNEDLLMQDTKITTINNSEIGIDGAGNQDIFDFKCIDIENNKGISDVHTLDSVMDCNTINLMKTEKTSNPDVSKSSLIQAAENNESNLTFNVLINPTSTHKIVQFNATTNSTVITNLEKKCDTHTSDEHYNTVNEDKNNEKNVKETTLANSDTHVSAVNSTSISIEKCSVVNEDSKDIIMQDTTIINNQMLHKTSYINLNNGNSENVYISKTKMQNDILHKEVIEIVNNKTEPVDDTCDSSTDFNTINVTKYDDTVREDIDEHPQLLINSSISIQKEQCPNVGKANVYDQQIDMECMIKSCKLKESCDIGINEINKINILSEKMDDNNSEINKKGTIDCDINGNSNKDSISGGNEDAKSKLNQTSSFDGIVIDKVQCSDLVANDNEYVQDMSMHSIKIVNDSLQLHETSNIKCKNENKNISEETPCKQINIIQEHLSKENQKVRLMNNFEENGENNDIKDKIEKSKTEIEIPTCVSSSYDNSCNVFIIDKSKTEEIVNATSLLEATVDKETANQQAITVRHISSDQNQHNQDNVATNIQEFQIGMNSPGLDDISGSCYNNKDIMTVNQEKKAKITKNTDIETTIIDSKSNSNSIRNEAVDTEALPHLEISKEEDCIKQHEGDHNDEICNNIYYATDEMNCSAKAEKISECYYDTENKGNDSYVLGNLEKVESKDDIYLNISSKKLNECVNNVTFNSESIASGNSDSMHDTKCLELEQNIKEYCKNTFNLPELNNTITLNPFETKSKICESPPSNYNMFVPIQENTFDVDLNRTTEIKYDEGNKDTLTENTIILNESLLKLNNESNSDNLEVHTEDEDTIEGPFLDEFETAIITKTGDHNIKNEDMIDFDELPAQENNDNEIFIDAETFEFLLNQNKSNVVVDSGKESLFLKFDPLFAKRESIVSLNKLQNTSKKATQVAHEVISQEKTLSSSCSANLHVEPIDIIEDANFNNSCKPTMIVNPAIKSAVSKIPTTPIRSNRLSLTCTSPAMAVVDQLLSLSGVADISDQDLTMHERNPEQSQIANTLTSLREMLQNKEVEVGNLRTESRELQDRLQELKSQVNNRKHECEAKFRNLIKTKEKLEETTELNKEKAKIVEEYEKTFASLVSELEQNRKCIAEERGKLIKERDEQRGHLSNIDYSYNDLVTKFDRSKQIILHMKNNEETYLKSVEEFDENILKMQNNYDLLKQHAASKLNQANLELEKMNKVHEAEVAKLNAMVKMEELRIRTLEKTLAQKTTESEKLTAICDELINRRMN